MEHKRHLIYMLRCKDNTLYTGYTTDLQRRLNMHEKGKGAKYTRGRGPFQVVYTETFPTKSEALRREIEIKQLSRKEKLGLIRSQKKEGVKNEGATKL
jgi:putative endonuclease